METGHKMDSWPGSPAPDIRPQVGREVNMEPVMASAPKRQGAPKTVTGLTRTTHSTHSMGNAGSILAACSLQATGCGLHPMPSEPQHGPSSLTWSGASSAIQHTRPSLGHGNGRALSVVLRRYLRPRSPASYFRPWPFTSSSPGQDTGHHSPSHPDLLPCDPTPQCEGPQTLST